MTVYVETLTDDEIKKRIGNAKKIVIVGCPACVNTSLAARSKAGIVHEFKEDSQKYVPAALLDKLDDLKTFLGGKGKSVVTLVAYTCGLDRNALKGFEKHSAFLDCELIIALSCFSGVLGLRKLFPHHQIIPGTKRPAGLLFSERELSEDGRIRKIIPGSARILKAELDYEPQELK